ncbi:hypothetical protein BD324DRAFT_638092 [Kockovaella imperatae]|uniref:AN1-type domain-containing protein n=1 Tax=Kockovaella imperatae TaxID=4999 RepID=A0A1Y1U7P3_9TREE|nr:hypothetical protein BD324DRAFT_638092 [Kockovaella imperatae]ORX34028.1 hypothetical protein BD324DRAFT_638092 [Kockovaella imperatae]
MTTLDIGQQCSSCTLIDFLPFTCPTCSLVFCKSHIQTHPCHAVAGPSRNPPKTFQVIGPGRCERDGCDKPTIEAIGGVGSEHAAGEGIARQVRCNACGGAFCTAHRQQKAHSCSGPKDYTVREDAAAIRKSRAQEVLEKTFPGQAGKTIPKVGPKVDDTRIKPSSPPRLPPSLPPAASAPSPSEPTAESDPGASSGSVRVKTRAEKIYEIHIRKIKSLAKPLDSRQRASDERRFFEWCVDLSGKGLSGWKATGKYDGKAERSWANCDIPLGKVIDLLITQTRTPRGITSDPSNTLGLLCLSALPDQPRAIIRSDLASPVSSIPDGCLVVLVRGFPERDHDA